MLECLVVGESVILLKRGMHRYSRTHQHCLKFRLLLFKELKEAMLRIGVSGSGAIREQQIPMLAV